MFSIPDGTSVAVVGAGVIGLSAAPYLAEAGIADVVLIEPAGLGAGATAIQASMCSRSPGTSTPPSHWSR